MTSTSCAAILRSDESSVHEANRKGPVPVGAVGQLFSGWLVALPGVDSHPRQPTLLGRPDARAESG